MEPPAGRGTSKPRDRTGVGRQRLPDGWTGFVLFWRVASSASVLLFLAACAGLDLSRPAVVKHYYLLEAAPAPSDTPAQFPVPIKINGFEVAPPFEDRSFVYRVGEQRYESDFYDEFFVAPRAMVTSLIADWLGARHIFAAALPPTSTLDAPYAMEGLVTSMYVDLRQQSQPTAVFALQVFVTRVGPHERRIVLERAYRHEFALSAHDPKSYADGLSQAFQLCLADLERDLRGLNITDEKAKD